MNLPSTKQSYRYAFAMRSVALSVRLELSDIERSDDALGGQAMPQKSIRQALNEALRQEMRRDPTRHRDRRGCRRRRRQRGPARRLRRRARRHQGPDRRVRRGARDRHADHRIGDHGRRRRRRGDRPAAGRRADVQRLPRRLLRPDLQPGRQVPLHVRRQGEDAAGDPHDDRRRPQRRGAALAKPVPHLHLGAGAEGASCRRTPTTPRAC